MKYVYVVTRIVENERKGVISIPNLGVHPALYKAQKHFSSVIKDRIKGGGTIVWESLTWGNQTGCQDFRMQVVREARISTGVRGFSLGEIENLRLEKWIFGEFK